MNGTPRAELNQGLAAYKEELTADNLASKRVEVAIVSFGEDKVLCDFTTAENFYPPTLEASGLTPIGQRIFQAEREFLQARADLSAVQ